MAVPKFDAMMLPVLQYLGSQPGSEPRTNREIRSFVADHFELSPEDRADTIPSGNPRYANNAMWACTYLKQAKLIVSPKRGSFVITERGFDFLKRNLPRITKNDLMEFPEFASFATKGSRCSEPPVENASRTSHDAAADRMDSSTPEELLQQSFNDINAALSSDLLDAIMQQSPDFFEKLVVDLLVAMGYGDSRVESGFITRKTGDEGIDGVIREDKLGFDNIYIQAKRWNPDASVNRPELQAFVGALTGAGATKGLFITTAHFSSGAKEYASKQHAVKLVLVDGNELAQLMIAHNVGVAVKQRYEIKSLDSDYFDTEESR